jgi:hypothetical protein
LKVIEQEVDGDLEEGNFDNNEMYGEEGEDPDMMLENLEGDEDGYAEMSAGNSADLEQVVQKLTGSIKFQGF